MFLLVISVLLTASGSSFAVEVNDSSAADRLKIYKCCRPGEDLEQPNSPESESRCIPNLANLLPLIYAPEKSDFLALPPENWQFIDNVRPRCYQPNELRFVPHNQNNPFVLFDDGNLLMEAGTDTYLGPEEYCLGSRSVLVCLPRRNESLHAAATKKARIRKCCGGNAAYNSELNSCVQTNGQASPEDEQSLLLASNSNNAKVGAGMEIVSGFPPKCPNLTIIGELTTSKLESDASLVVDGQHIPAEEFCVERVQAGNSRHLLPINVFACFEHAIEKSAVLVSDIRFTLFPVGFIISAVFLAATLATGWLLPASHHVLHWRCQTHHVACLMLGDIVMASIQLAGKSLTGEPCRILAILAHFFFLSTFFWLNTMCFNIWWTFRDLRPASLEKGQELLRLRFYAAYAWGGPLIVAGLAAILDHLPQSPDQTYLRPRFGEKHCWFYGDMEILAYFFGPIGVLLGINLLFFAATARELTCGLWKGEFVKSTTERAALGKVCLKLVVVMGVPWIFDVISWMAGGPAFLWYVTDFCNAAQGVLIFIVVGCQPQVRAALKRLWFRNPRAKANRQGNGLSTTSHGMPSMGDSVTQNPSTKTAPLETIC